MNHHARGALRRALQATSACLLAALAACGGGGGGDAPVLPTAQACSPNNPWRGDAESATTLASLATEKSWVHDYVQSQYLWYREMPAVDAAAAPYSVDTAAGVYDSLDAYFMALLTPNLTSSGAPRDKFSFTMPTRQVRSLLDEGTALGNGIEWRMLQTKAPRGLRVAYVHPGSVAEAAGVRRGDTLVTVDGVSADDSTGPGVAVLNAALFPSAAGSHAYVFARGSTTYGLTLATGVFTMVPVSSRVLDVGGQKVGYLLFNDHVLTAEQPLIDAFNAMAGSGVSDLVLDLRYNGGGYLYIASQVARMIAGPARTGTQVFERTVYSDKRSSENDSTPFYGTACLPDPNANFSCRSSATLPTLNLSRVYVLVSGSTCSASEAIINGLRGIDVDVRIVGSTTCGKPYGFVGQDNCGVSYFPIEFQGVNAKGFGDYGDGFTPGTGPTARYVSGCAVADDLEHALGDTAEGQLAAALALRATGSCPASVTAAPTERAQGVRGEAARALVLKPPVLASRIAAVPRR